MKIRPVGNELFHADRYDEAKSRFLHYLRTHQKLFLLVRYLFFSSMSENRKTFKIKYPGSQRVFYFLYNVHSKTFISDKCLKIYVPDTYRYACISEGSTPPFFPT